MKFKAENITPIEVKFRDVCEATENKHTRNSTNYKKLSSAKPTTTLKKKATVIMKNKSGLTKLLIKILSFCKKLGNISFFKKWIIDVPKLCDMLIDTINGAYKGTPYSSIVMVAFAMLYTLSPVDILCDKIPILGVLDDAAIIKLVLDTIKNDLETYSFWKETQEAV